MVKKVKSNLKRKATSVLLSTAMTVSMAGGTVSMDAFAAEGARESAPVFLSAKNYGGEYTDAFQKVAYTNDGGFVVMGYTMGNSSSPEWTYTGSGKNHTNNDAVLVKFNAAHEVEWSKAYGGTGVDVFNDMAILQDGRIAVIGRSSYTSSDKNIKGVSWYVMLINPSNPNEYKEYRVGGTAGDQGYGISATPDGGFVIAGWSASTSGYITSTEDGENYTATTQLWEPVTGTDESIPNRIASTSSDSVVIKFDSQGEIAFCALHDYAAANIESESSKNERLEAVATDSNGDIIIAGYDNIAKNVTNAMIAKLSGTDGSVIWERVAGRKETNVPSDKADYIKASYSGITVLGDDSVVVTGSANNEANTDEKWGCISANDSIVVHYGKDGSIVNAENYGTISDNNSRPESVTADRDGGYIVTGSFAGVVKEDFLIKKGYDFGNYGANDALLIKYDSSDNIVWSGNYGSTSGDWINAIAVGSDGELIAVGESQGKNGNPIWGNNGGVDGIVMSTRSYEAATTQPIDASKDGNVTWADGTYNASGQGYAGKDSITVSINIEDGKLISGNTLYTRDTDLYVNAAQKIYADMLQKQSADVDVVSGATFSSNGIKEAMGIALSKAAAKYVDNLIEKAELEGDDTKKPAFDIAAAAFSELSSKSIEQMTKKESLETMAGSYGVTLKLRENESFTTPDMTTPVLSDSDMAHNDTYYKLQKKWYENIGADSLKEEKLTGEGVKIAVIDSGLTSSHEDIDYSKIAEGYDYINNHPLGTEEYPFVDNNGHGTAVTGVLAAKADNGIGVTGLLSDATIVPLAFSPTNSKKEDEKLASSELAAQIIKDAVDKFEVDVITTSFDVVDSDALREAVSYAASKNVIITAAAGNSSTADSTGEDAYIYPAAYDETVSVGSVDDNNVVRTNSQKNDKVFVTAPGQDIVLLDVSRQARCKISSGTSYSSPMVAAMAVAAKQNYKDLTLEEFKTLLKNTSTDAGEEGYDTSYGYGIINMSAFAKAVISEYDVTLDKTELKLAPGESEKLEASVINTWNDTQANITWKSENEEVATVDETGSIQAVKDGEADIVVSTDAGSKSSICKVTVVTQSTPAPIIVPVVVNPTPVSTPAPIVTSTPAPPTPAPTAAATATPAPMTPVISGGSGGTQPVISVPTATPVPTVNPTAAPEITATPVATAEPTATPEIVPTKAPDTTPVATQEPEVPTASPAVTTTPTVKKVEKGDTVKASGSTYKVIKVAGSKNNGTLTLIKAANKASVVVPKSVKLADKKTYIITNINSKAFTGNKIRKVTIGANVEKIGKNAFASSKATSVIIKSKKLTKSSVKGAFKNSKVSNISVKVGNKKANSKYIKKYQKIFTKSNVGHKEKIK